MSLGAATQRSERRHDRLRWAASALAVLALHAGMVALVLRTAPQFELPPAPPEAVLLDLPPEAAAALQPPRIAPQAPEPPPPVALPVPLPPPLPPPPEPVLAPALPAPPAAVPPPPRPLAARPDARPRPIPPPARPNPVPAAVAPAATPPAAVTTNAVPAWRSELIARLQRARRYPDAARSRGDQGVAVVTFTMDRSGRVLAAALVRSSGIAALDDEAIAMLHRAEPLPAMPPEMSAQSITLTLPVNFALR